MDSNSIGEVMEEGSTKVIFGAAFYIEKDL